MSWLPGFAAHPNNEESDEEDKTTIDDQFEELIDQYTEIVEKKEKEKEKDEILFHFTVAMPLFEIFMLSRKSPVSHPQVFCRLRMQNIFFQRSFSNNERTEYLFSIDDIELVNEFATMKKFEIVFRKKPKPTTMTEDESDEFLSKLNSDFGDDESVDTDGLNQPSSYKNYSNILNCNSNPPLILFEYAVSKVSSNQGKDTESLSGSLTEIDIHKIEEYETDIKLSIQHFELYFDRLLVATILNNFTRLEDNYQNIRRENVKFDVSEDPKFDTSKSSLNLSMRKETSIRHMVQGQKENHHAQIPFKSININVGGVSFFVPDTLGFEQDSTKVLCFFIGEIKILSGKFELSSTNLLLDDENDFSFNEALDKNKVVFNTLYAKNASTRFKQEHKFQEYYQSYEVSVYDVNCMFLPDVTLLLSDVALENHEATDELKLIQNFDIKLLYDSCLLPKSNELYKTRLY